MRITFAVAAALMLGALAIVAGARALVARRQGFGPSPAAPRTRSTIGQ